jgi:hypothetical protein
MDGNNLFAGQCARTSWSGCAAVKVRALAAFALLPFFVVGCSGGDTANTGGDASTLDEAAEQRAAAIEERADQAVLVVEREAEETLARYNAQAEEAAANNAADAAADAEQSAREN